MILRFGLTGDKELTQKEVADILGISQSYISRLEKKIMQVLKRKIEEKRVYMKVFTDGEIIKVDDEETKQKAELSLDLILNNNKTNVCLQLFALYNLNLLI